MYYFLDPDTEFVEDLEQEEEQKEEDSEELTDQEQEPQSEIELESSPGSESSGVLPVEAAEDGARAALTLSASDDSETIDYSEQIGYILDCNIAMLIGICFISIYLIIDRIFRL